MQIMQKKLRSITQFYVLYCAMYCGNVYQSHSRSLMLMPMVGSSLKN